MSFLRFTVASKVFFSSSSFRPSLLAIFCHGLSIASNAPVTWMPRLAAQIAEVQNADHLVGDEQRVGIVSGYGGLRRELNVRVLNCSVISLSFGNEIPPSELDDLRQLIAQKNGKVRFQSRASRYYRLTE